MGYVRGCFFCVISIHALLAESDQRKRCNQSQHPISIHALLAESDRGRNPAPRKDTDFYPRSPCGERHGEQNRPLRHSGFLSTLSLRRATKARAPSLTPKLFLSTLSLRRATVTAHTWQGGTTDFYPRSPCGERPAGPDRQRAGPGISIHALLAESDEYWVGGYGTANNFYPRSPCGERPRPPATAPTAVYFYPRSPCGERRVTDCIPVQQASISIHALLAESD